MTGATGRAVRGEQKFSAARVKGESGAMKAETSLRLLVVVVEDNQATRSSQGYKAGKEGKGVDGNGSGTCRGGRKRQEDAWLMLREC